MPRDGQVSAAIKDVSGKAADGELGAEKCQLAVLQDAGHQAVSLGGDVHANPDKRELGVKPVQTKQETAFRKLIHVNPSSANVVKLHPIYARTPEGSYLRGSWASREERDSFYAK